ncbi:DUF2059 domain-containing protein [Neisseria zalophi]|uniref:DUF2059 domain-containing protein n=1 Tax=Neisseria zalophi TaxID=640030 RepID=A0A5J6PXG7_9NEIS|nr:DUF2059 domain-containing protein [Neisseria zalophi]QEY26896.1 DUF2059 domain-containing protein [Neisseria zalophi]
MKKLHCLAAIILGMAVATVQAAPASRDSVEKLLQIQNFDRALDDQLKTLPTTVRNELRYAPLKEIPADKQAQVDAVLDRYVDELVAYTDNPTVRAATHYLSVQNVQRIYTQEEVDALIQFYNTPVGKRIVEKMPRYITATMVVSMNMVKDRMIDFQRQRRRAFEGELRQILCDGDNDCQLSRK